MLLLLLLRLALGGAGAGAAGRLAVARLARSMVWLERVAGAAAGGAEAGGGRSRARLGVGVTGGIWVVVVVWASMGGEPCKELQDTHLAMARCNVLLTHMP